MQTQNTGENTAVALRARLRRQRAELPENQRSRGALLMRGRLFTWLNVARERAAGLGRPLQSVAAFWPMAEEPDLRPLLQQWVDAGITVCLPVVRERGAALEFRRWTPDAPMQAGAYGIAEPQAGDLVVPDVLLVPTLGYTADAERLGYGGGYYDRTLAALTAAGHPHTAIGIAWDEGLLPQDYKPAPHDVPLAAVLTPSGWVPEAPLETGGLPAGRGSVFSHILR
ncbi:5-formyltetrahydrofolate cyclo-ligase [Bordetella pseudohinzii]|uniref:5-formyltetrahydrofolate cyclo-ligase n=1 Tax=Bordetella pseudohinzii TaxID=1331258 RepID=A0A0J6C6T8_9BORD|nr:5-formyltetrahydrofolate cyclo-ligase [Bordetella pseudohinzii]ANY17916.1 5-formyltetrahydrofolate cyclo-ligase [Bordetella pseudohinzii]KMM26436.1 5-formyltetrahydrofolate cyclo-ligase [Bordetella pseudohinzii]KXA79034.1 5-formyltetrahydrofolate cyclo-ligase [Bordetella pseudohinzii]KXA80140.1 5-formyltetrahydrofolate cyclo-ligase [Bordetella pseudohinzii]CUI79227.1 5-formyltetrahydrofolate cyclo-ligase family protein [Bordetella pseudohinzii]